MGLSSFAYVGSWGLADVGASGWTLLEDYWILGVDVTALDRGIIDYWASGDNIICTVSRQRPWDILNCAGWLLIHGLRLLVYNLRLAVGSDRLHAGSWVHLGGWRVILQRRRLSILDWCLGHGVLNGSVLRLVLNHVCWRSVENRFLLKSLLEWRGFGVDLNLWSLELLIRLNLEIHFVKILANVRGDVARVKSCCVVSSEVSWLVSLHFFTTFFVKKTTL